MSDVEERIRRLMKRGYSRQQAEQMARSVVPDVSGRDITRAFTRDKKTAKAEDSPRTLPHEEGA